MNNKFEIWSQDLWDKKLIDRVTDVLSDRTNQFIDRPEPTTSSYCKQRTHTLDRDKNPRVNSNHLPNRILESQLRGQLLLNNRDCNNLNESSKNSSCLTLNSTDDLSSFFQTPSMLMSSSFLNHNDSLATPVATKTIYNREFDFRNQFMLKKI